MPEEEKAVYWTAERQNILEFLRKNAPPLADLYEGAVIMLCEGILPGRERFICHAVREICNRLYYCLPENDNSNKTNQKQADRSRLDYVGKVEEISRKWEYPFQPEVATLSDDILIPIQAFEKMNTLIYLHRETSMKQKEKAFQIFFYFSKNDPNLKLAVQPAIELWLDTREWFVKHTHDREGREAEQELQEIRIYFERFEASLLSFSKPFFENIEELDEILDKANA